MISLILMNDIRASLRELIVANVGHMAVELEADGRLAKFEMTVQGLEEMKAGDADLTDVADPLRRELKSIARVYQKLPST